MQHITNAFTHLRARVSRPTNRRMRRTGQAAAAAAVTVGVLAAAMPAASADTMNPNATSTYDEPRYWTPPNADGYSAWSNGDGSWTNSGPDFSTTYFSRSATAELEAAAQEAAKFDGPTLAAVQQGCTEAFGALGGLVGVAAKRPTAGEVAGNVVGAAICSVLVHPSAPNTDLATAAARGECYQVDSYGRTGITNWPGYCFDN